MRSEKAPAKESWTRTIKRF